MTVGIEEVFPVGMVHPFKIGTGTVMLNKICIGEVIFNSVTTVIKKYVVRRKENLSIKRENKCYSCYQKDNYV